MLKSVRGMAADVLYGLFERIMDDALPQGSGLSPRKPTPPHPTLV